MNLLATIRRLVLGCIVLTTLGIGAVPAQGGDQHLVQLPLVVRNYPIQGLWGYVRDDGVPADGVELALYRYPPGGPQQFVASTTTAASGLYVFVGMPALPTGHEYVVRYTNDSDNSRLRQASSLQVGAYAPGDSIHAADFDLANVPLESPSAGEAVGLPRSFTWVKRPASPGDHYVLEFSSLSGVPLVASAATGWVNSYYLVSLPPNLSYNTPYLWTVHVLLPGAAFGINFERREICFGSCPEPAGW